MKFMEHVWTTNAGLTIKVKKMSTPHIVNCIKCLNGGGKTSLPREYMDNKDKWLTIFNSELHRRKSKEGIGYGRAGGRAVGVGIWYGTGNGMGSASVVLGSGIGAGFGNYTGVGWGFGSSSDGISVKDENHIPWIK